MGKDKDAGFGGENIRIQETSQLMITISTSQIGLFKLCPRKHHYLKVERSVKPKSGKGAERGKTLHRVVEQYLKSSETDDIETFSRKSGLYTPTSKRV